ncbi:rifin [Plasmodium falciparum IGH-CR14]|uniref:Rifin n=1 Tax=Plasmodium falciparum IGH-CR14 TaxID=580059 RepID=A0A0L1I532_PLAFA|nr:rifin [Plasmodium falciparum IGH-CR14]
MKIHYINALLFALPLNILVHNKNKPCTKPHHTKTNRSLCECDLYVLNYDSDPGMKSVMEIFNKQTQQRFHEYDERMKNTRQKCKDKCDKEIQKIILKDKIEKQMAQELITLETKITTEDIPTCICEKSLADKTENFCLNCGKNMTAIAPWWGLICGTGYAGWTNYVATTIAKMATDAGIEAGVKVGLANVMKIVGQLIKTDGYGVPTIKVADLMAVGKFTKDVTFSDIFKAIDSNASGLYNIDLNAFFSWRVQGIAQKPYTLKSFTKEATAVETAFANAKEGVLAEGASKTSSLTTGITASLIAIVVIVLIMIIIYLVLRYRRKKKMKKKLQYIKLLEE